MNQMKTTRISSLLSSAGIAAIIAAMATWAFYGYFPPLRPASSVLLFLMAAVCAVAGVYIRKKITNEEIGLDRSQLSPLVVAKWMLFGQAVAWSGATLGGGFTGIGLYVAVQMGKLSAASNDAPGVLAGILGGLAAAVGGIWLERSCVAPPLDPPVNQACGTA